MDDAKEQGGDIKDSDYWYQVTDIPPAICAAFLNRLVIPERIMLKDIPEGKRLKDPEGLTYKKRRVKYSLLFSCKKNFSPGYSVKLCRYKQERRETIMDCTPSVNS